MNVCSLSYSHLPSLFCKLNYPFSNNHIGVPNLSLEDSEVHLEDENRHLFLQLMRKMLQCDRLSASDLLKDPCLDSSRNYS